MGNIVLLDELTINQIAAGEVIERPASVIKEMVENSIDAGATNITVEIKNGGISFIRITDNGKGIAKDDIELAFERHATSKIRSAYDLSTVKSMGFRGEALASIAAIANVELVSKTEFDEIGTRIVVEGGKVLSIDEIGCSKGTTITVRNLFFNTPVRYKFLKKDFTESGYIEDVITRIALVHPEIAIKFINTGKTVIQTNGNGDINSVIYTIFGKEVASNLLPVNYDYEDITIKGVIGKTDIARSNRSNQIFFVNQRYVKDKTLSSAVDQAYKGMLPMGKFAFLVLNIEMLPSKVDVNVHPAKLEVRFAEENVIFKAMYHAVKDTLAKDGLMSDREKIQEIKAAAEDSFRIKDAKDIMEKTYALQEENELPKAIKKERVASGEPTEEFIKPKTSPVLEMEEIKANSNVFEDLKKLQEELRKEVEQNPNLQLTDKYKQMEEQYNQIIKPISEVGENNLNNIQEEDKSNNTQEEQGEAESNNVQENTNDLQKEEAKKTQEKITETQNQDVENNIAPIVKDGKIENIEFDFELPSANNVKTKNTEENTPKEATKIVEEKPQESTKMPSFEEMYKQLFGKEPYGGRKQEEIKQETETERQEPFYTIDAKMEDNNLSMFEEEQKFQRTSYKYIGIAFNTNIIIEMKDELYIIDKCLAHERIMYEEIKTNFYEQGEKAAQLLLLPDIITLSHKEMEVAKDNFELFEQAGFVLEEFGENTIKLSGVPEICVDLDTAELFKDIIDEIDTVARTAKQEKEEKFILAIAKKSAIKSNTILPNDEVDRLMEKLLNLQNPFVAPDGGQIAIKMSKYEIERKFSRK